MTTRHVSVRVTCYGAGEASWELLETVCEPGRPARWYQLEVRSGTTRSARDAAHRAVDMMIEHQLREAEAADEGD